LTDRTAADLERLLIEHAELWTAERFDEWKPWAPFEQRAADALLALCAPAPADDEFAPTLAPLVGIELAVPPNGTDEIANLAAVCPAHHRLLVPHGRLALTGNRTCPTGSSSSPRAVRRRRSRCDAAWVTRLPTSR
jgi:hypothetical protein